MSNKGASGARPAIASWRTIVIGALCLVPAACSTPMVAPRVPVRVERTWAVIDDTTAMRIQQLGTPVEVRSKGLTAWQCDAGAMRDLLDHCEADHWFYRDGTRAIWFAGARLASHPVYVMTDVWTLNTQPKVATDTGHKHFLIACNGGGAVNARLDEGRFRFELDQFMSGHVGWVRADAAEIRLSGRFLFEGDIPQDQALVILGRVGRVDDELDLYCTVIWTVHADESPPTHASTDQPTLSCRESPSTAQGG